MLINQLFRDIYSGCPPPPTFDKNRKEFEGVMGEKERSEEKKRENGRKKGKRRQKGETILILFPYFI